MNLTRLFVLWMAFICGHGCAGDEKSSPVHLLFGIYSYETRPTVEKKLGDLAGRERIALSASDQEVSSGDEPMSLDYQNYEHLGVRGTLSFGFFEGQLMSVIFYPEDCARYLAQIRVNPPESSAEYRTGMDYQNRCYHIWQDPILHKRFEDWIRRHS